MIANTEFSYINKISWRFYMGMKRLSLIYFLAFTIIGFYFIDSAQALEFVNWSGNWFKVQVIETGKAGTVVTEFNPDGGEVVINNERSTYVYLKLQKYEVVDDARYFEVGYCSFNGTRWYTEFFRYPPEDKIPLIWPIIGGEPTRFLTLFNLKREQSQGIIDEYWIPIEVRGNEANSEVGRVYSGSFKSIGGIFLEEIGYPITTQRGIGSLKFNGSLIVRENVENVVPVGCKDSAP
jgi:hypothetical protein